MTERYYVYAITDAAFHLPQGISGFGGGALFVLPYADLGAVVSRIRAAEGEEVAPGPTPENLLLHERVVETVHAAGSAIPVRFGTVLRGADAVTSALAQQYAVLRADVERIGGKVEVGVSALWRPRDRDADSSADGQDADDRQDSSARSAERRPGLAYLRARQREYHQAESARARAQALAQQLDAELGLRAIQHVRSIYPTARLALRERYLLERDQVSAFKAAFEAVQQRHTEVSFLLSGPWPPYSFVTPPARPDSELESVQPTRRDQIAAGIDVSAATRIPDVGSATDSPGQPGG